MQDTTTPSLATHVPPWRRRLLATGMAVGVGATGLTSDGGRRSDPRPSTPKPTPTTVPQHRRVTSPVSTKTPCGRPPS